MRANSGEATGKNNDRNPTLRDHERSKGVSGEAVHGEQQHAAEPDRQSARKRQSG